MSICWKVNSIEVNNNDLIARLTLEKERLNSKLHTTEHELARIERDRPSMIIKDVIFNNPATIIKWADGTKTVVKTQNGEPYDPEKGLAMAISKKIFGNKYDYYNTFLKYLKKANKTK